MRKVTLGLLAGLMMGGAVAAAAEEVMPAAETEQAMERRDEVPVSRLDLEMNETDAKVVFLKEPYDDSAFPVAVIDGDTHHRGRVSVTGSFSRQFLKKSLLIEFDGGARWRGRGRISLHAMSTDGAYMREWQAWNLMAALGMARPDFEYVRLFINGEYVGLFLFIEWIDGNMFERYGLGGQGQFFHPIDSAFCGDMSAANQSRLAECWMKLAPRDEDFAPLRGLIDQVNATPVEEFDGFLERNFDADSVIDWIIVNTLTSNGDTYNKNYFIHRASKTGKWMVVPWDYDLSFGRNADPVLPYPRNILNGNFTYHYPPELGNPNPLKEKTLKNPRLFERFNTTLAHVLGVRNDETRAAGFGWFKPENFAARVDAIARTIAEDVRDEKYPGYRDAGFDEHVEAIKYYNLMRYSFLKKLVLEPTPFNTAHWLPYTAYPSFTPVSSGAAAVQPPPLVMTAHADTGPGAGAVVLQDELLARPVGMVRILGADRPVRMRMEVEAERAPEPLPPGEDAARCVQRNWFLDMKTPQASLTAEVTLDYSQESSLHHELGARLDDERRLTVWVRRDGEWQRLETRVNQLANTLAVSGLDVPPSRVLHFVACMERRE